MFNLFSKGKETSMKHSIFTGQVEPKEKPVFINDPLSERVLALAERVLALEARVEALEKAKAKPKRKVNRGTSDKERAIAVGLYKHLNMHQGAIAKMFDVHYSTISDWVNDDRYTAADRRDCLEFLADQEGGER